MWWGQNCELKPPDLHLQFPQQDCTSGGYYIPVSHINVSSAMHSAWYHAQHPTSDNW